MHQANHETGAFIAKICESIDDTSLDLEYNEDRPETWPVRGCLDHCIILPELAHFARNSIVLVPIQSSGLVSYRFARCVEACDPTADAVVKVKELDVSDIDVCSAMDERELASTMFGCPQGAPKEVPALSLIFFRFRGGHGCSADGGASDSGTACVADSQ